MTKQPPTIPTLPKVDDKNVIFTIILHTALNDAIERQARGLYTTKTGLIRRLIQEFVAKEEEKELKKKY